MANYLREPYSTDLDFGTGEWSIGSWVNNQYGPRFNLLTKSEQFDNAVWLKTTSYISVDSVIAPNGVLSADTYTTQAGNSEIGQAITNTATTVTASIYVKKNTTRYCFIQIVNAFGGSNAVRQFFDLDANSGSGATATAQTFGSGFAKVSASIAPESNGWLRATLTCTVPAANCCFVFSTSSTDAPATIAANQSIYIWGADLRISGTGSWIPYQAVNTGTETFYGVIAERAYSSGPKITLQMVNQGNLQAVAYDGTNPARTVTTDAAYNTGTWLKAEATYKAGKLAILINGVEVKSTVGAPLLSLNSRYNLLTYTEQFDNSSWIKTGGIRSFGSGSTADAVISPSGSLSADFIAEDLTTNNEHSVSINTFGVGVAGTQYTFSAYLKAGTRQYGGITLQNNNGAYVYVVADLLATTNIVTKTGNLGVSGVSYAATSVGNGWIRLSVTMDSTTTSFYPQVFISNIATPTTFIGGRPTYNGDGTSGIYIWGAQLEPGSTAKSYQRVGAATDFDFQAPLTIGNSYDLTAPFPGSLALVKLSATVPTAEQALWMYNQEKQMFQPNAQITLPDSNAIQDISYDDLTDTWVAASTTNTSYWNGLVRTNSVAVPAGTYSRLVSGSGMHLSARITTNPGVDITIPDYKVRTKIKKKSEKSKKNSIAIFDYTPVQFTNATLTNGSSTMVCSTVSGTPYIGMTISGTGITPGTTILGINGTSYYLSTTYSGTTGSTYTVGQTSFDLPVGYTANLVYSNGSIKREGSTKDWTRAFDGFKETVIFGTSPGNVSVQIHCQTS